MNDKFSALLILAASREECGLAQCMREKRKGSEIFMYPVSKLNRFNSQMKPESQ